MTNLAARRLPAESRESIHLTAVSFVLVVAPDHVFRRSLEFVLEAEGFAVDSHALLSAAIVSPLAKIAACAVVDEDAIKNQASGRDALGGLAKPVVLLVDRLPPFPYAARTRVLVKPMLGNALIETVQNLITGSVAI